MTTNVYDLNAGLMTGDSRWSIEGSQFVLYTDECDFDKLYWFSVGTKNFCVMFAGNSYLIHTWKEWFKVGAHTSGLPEPDFVFNGQTLTMCIALADTKEIRYERGQSIKAIDARFAGTGAYEAHGCWKANACARKAVETAKVLDRFSGGLVKYLELASLNNNVNLSTGFDALKPSFLDKGMVMYNTAPKGSALPIKEAAANDAEVQKLVDDISSGKVVASAPCDAMYTPWDEGEKTKLRAALKEIFE